MNLTKLMKLGLTSALAAVALAGCGSSQTEPAAAAEPATEQTQETVEQQNDLSNKTVGVLVVTTQSQWCNDIIDGVTTAADQYGAKVIVSDSQVSVDNEMSGMENLINSQVDAIVVNAMNAAGLADLAKQAQDKGIYVIGWSELLANYDALVTEDYDREAEMMADAIAGYIDEKGIENAEMAEIWLADAANPDTNAGLFKAALDKAFEEKLVSGKNVTIVNSQYATDSDTAMNQGEAILAANPEVNIIFTQSDEMGVAVAQAVASKGLTGDDIMICGLDGTDQAVQAILSGSSPLKYTIFADPKSLGEKIGGSIFNYFESGTASDVVTEYTLIDSSNAADFAAN